MFVVLFHHILPLYKEGNGVLISGEKRVPLFMLSHTAQKGDFAAFNRRKTIVFGDLLFFFRAASANFYEEFLLPTYFLMLSFFFSFPFENFFLLSYSIIHQIIVEFLKVASIQRVTSSISQLWGSMGEHKKHPTGPLYFSPDIVPTI